MNVKTKNRLFNDIERIIEDFYDIGIIYEKSPVLKKKFKNYKMFEYEFRRWRAHL